MTMSRGCDIDLRAVSMAPSGLLQISHDNFLTRFFTSIESAAPRRLLSQRLVDGMQLSILLRFSLPPACGLVPQRIDQQRKTVGCRRLQRHIARLSACLADRQRSTDYRDRSSQPMDRATLS